VTGVAWRAPPSTKTERQAAALEPGEQRAQLGDRGGVARPALDEDAVEQRD
jgi:hypothetical protein